MRVLPGCDRRVSSPLSFRPFCPLSASPLFRLFFLLPFWLRASRLCRVPLAAPPSTAERQAKAVRGESTSSPKLCPVLKFPGLPSSNRTRRATLCPARDKTADRPVEDRF